MKLEWDFIRKFDSEEDVELESCWSFFYEIIALNKLNLEPRDEYVLISDAAESIRNAFVSVFGNRKW